MEQPVPVNLSALKNILANAKKVMNKVEDISPSVSSSSRQNVSETKSYNTEHYNERDEREPNYEQHSQQLSSTAPLQNFSREHIMASKLPQNIKEAMINRPIDKPSMGTSFSAEDIEEINPKRQQPQQRQQQPQQLSESRNNSDLITISRTELKEIMNETLMNFLKSSYEKKLTESAITKTINLLIKEGKITTKKKTV
jgi:hypothetical protein